MATYKVLQDIEAEDKLVGPFSLRQFIYLAIVLVLGFIAYQLARASVVLALPFLLPILFFGALAAPLGQDQSTEVWLLAKIRFFLKPRKRVWNQDGIKQLVTITVPKKEERQLTKNLSQTEVKSRLNALANTLDTRGWAVKNANVNTADFKDILDVEANPTAQNLDRMIQQSSQAHRQQAVEHMKHPDQPQQPNDYWFMKENSYRNQPGYSHFDKDEVVAPKSQSKTSAVQPDANELAMIEKIKSSKQKQRGYSHLKVIKPAWEKDQEARNSKQSTGDVRRETSSKHNPDIMRLASDNDKNISTIAREAHRSSGDDDEVVVSLR